MRCELPELKRCCFCFPLRYGLLVWAYLKLAVGLAAMCYFITGLIYTISFFVRHDYRYYIKEIVICMIIFTVMVIDNIIYVVFIVSLHKKNYRIMRAYYIYLLIIFGMTTILFLLLLGYQLYIDEIVILFYYSYLQTIIGQSVIEFINIVIQIYLILLVRSEFRKLSGNWQFRFENNAAEAECVMTTTVAHEFTRECHMNSNEISTPEEYTYISENGVNTEKPY